VLLLTQSRCFITAQISFYKRHSAFKTCVHVVCITSHKKVLISSSVCVCVCVCDRVGALAGEKGPARQHYLSCLVGLLAACAEVSSTPVATSAIVTVGYQC